jgi:hypothetical protein
MNAVSLFVAGLAAAILSTAAANAVPANAAPKAAAPWVGCSGSSGMHSPTCKNVGNWTSYAECMEAGLKIGWRNGENSWYCSSLGLK